MTERDERAYAEYVDDYHDLLPEPEEDQPTPNEVLADFLRRQGWTVIPPDPDAEFHVRGSAPKTSRAIEAVMQEDSLQYRLLQVFDLGGYTDYEIEDVTGRSHQSVSALRNTLVRKGLLRDSGVRRRNRYGNEAIVWVRTEVDPIISTLRRR